jgi:hypothetical protein
MNTPINSDDEVARLHAVAEAKGDPGDAGALRAAVHELATYRASLATMRQSRDRLQTELTNMYGALDYTPV